MLRAQHIAASIKSAPLEELEHYIERYAQDPRKQVQAALKSAQRRLDHERDEQERIANLYSYMEELAQDIDAQVPDGLIIGIDEVGRGALAGPLTVCALALPADPQIMGLNDSKKLSPERREILALEIKEKALIYTVVHIPASDIDRDGMAHSLRRAMKEALDGIQVPVRAVLIDGNPMHLHPLERCVVGGDSKLACVAAASILAKVTRDQLMRELDEEYPAYGFAQSKGYGSAAHIEAIKTHGLCAVHRSSFCGNFYTQGSLF